MKSVRLGAYLETRLDRVAQLSGQSVSDVMRHAVDEHCKRVLDKRLDIRLADMIGVIRGGGGRAERTGEAFTELLEEKRKRRRSMRGCLPEQ